MSKEKQIDERYEMAEIIAKNSHYQDETWDASDFEWAAHCVQMAGYRKQIEGEWRETRTGFHCSVCLKKPGVIANRGVFLSKFCPNCGAKMKGGAE